MEAAGDRGALRHRPRAAHRRRRSTLGSEHAHGPSSGGRGARAVATDLGVDLSSPRAGAEAAAAGSSEGGVPEVSEDAAEIIRVESGRPRFGREMDAETMPAEAGITDRAVSFEKGCYIGQETVARLHYRGKPNRTCAACA